jgi:hypothetical protein
VFVVEPTMSWSSGGAGAGWGETISGTKLGAPYRITKAIRHLNTAGREEKSRRKMVTDC